MSESSIGVAVVGYGYWGPNIARNIVERPEFELVALCERDADAGARFAQRYPGITIHRELDDALDDPRVEAVLVATPPRTHYALAAKALDAGRHVLVEKPLTTKSEDAIDLIERAAAQSLVLMPGHTFLYSPPVNKIRELIRSGSLGDVHFITSSRMNLGKYQHDGVICDLAPHDLSILMYWLDAAPIEMSANGQEIFQPGVPETAFLTMTFDSGARANIGMSWLAPRKIRQTVVVGSRRMIQYDDSAADESVRVYDRGLDFTAPPENFGEYRLTYRTGDMIAPRIEVAEPLSLELQDFANSIRTGNEPRSNARLGLQIVLALEAAEASLRRRGAPVRVPIVREADDANVISLEGRLAA